MTYYPQNAPRYASPPRDLSSNNRGHAPPYSQSYTPPMRANRVSDNLSREQLPGEEWVRAPDGTFMPANENSQFTPSRPAQPRRRAYWE